MALVYFATKNKGKVATLGTALSRYGIEIEQKPLDLPEPRTEDVRAIAKEKALYAWREIRKPCIALDAGFFIHALNGFPKAFVNFALETIGIEGMLRLAEGKERACEFRECLAYLDEELREPMLFETRITGTLAGSPRGEERPYAWSALFFVFVPAGHALTLAEMSPGEFDEWRHARLPDSLTTKFAEWYLRRPTTA